MSKKNNDSIIHNKNNDFMIDNENNDFVTNSEINDILVDNWKNDINDSVVIDKSQNFNETEKSINQSELYFAIILRLNLIYITYKYVIH